MNFATENLVFDPLIIRRFDVNGPRYTSYPTADRFVEAFDSDAAKLWLGKRTIAEITQAQWTHRNLIERTSEQERMRQDVNAFEDHFVHGDVAVVAALTK